MRRLLFVVACCAASASLAQAPHEVPRPARGWVTDLTRTLRTSTIDGVNAVASKVNAEGVGQIGVAVVHTTGIRPPRQYATDLFNAWGVGNAGKDDGILLFLALGDRKAEIILGSGIDSDASVAVTDRIMAEDVVANMKRGQADIAVRMAVDSLAAHLRSGPTRHAGGGSGDSGILGSMTLSAPSPVKEGEFPWWTVLLSGVGLVGGVGGHRYMRHRPRKCEACGQKRVKLDEASDDAHLSAGERMEEQMGSVDYDVWWCDPCGDALVLRYGRLLSGKKGCAKCGFKTASSQSLTLRSATEYSSGLVQSTDTCGHCSHVHQYTRSTPRLRRHRSGSGGGFGGGSSSGRGSSGSW